MTAATLTVEPTTRKTIRAEGDRGVFALPWVVAKDEGLFAAEGIDVEFVRREGRQGDPVGLIADHRLVPSFGAYNSFEQGQADVYRACEWGQIRRAKDSGRGGQIIGKRAAVAVMGLYALPESGITHPQDLRGKTVAVNFHHGSHYAAIQMLEGFLEPDEIKVVHPGGPQQRFEALVRGEVAAAALMEPWNTLAEKRGYLKIIETHYVGSEIAGKDLDAETFEAINRAIKEAVRRINADKRAYLHYLIESLPPQYAGEITVDDFYLPRLRYVDPAPYPAGEFEKTFNWMVRWGLIPADTSYEALVDNRITAAPAQG